MKRQPPAQIYLWWCPTCGRTDRTDRLAERHFTGGKRCYGTPESLTYDLRESGASMSPALDDLHRFEDVDEQPY